MADRQQVDDGEKAVQKPKDKAIHKPKDKSIGPSETKERPQ